MSVLITGAAGRIGSMLRQRLPRLGHQLRLFDRTTIGNADADGSAVIVGEIADSEALSQAFSTDVEAVVHLAGQATEAPWPVVQAANIDALVSVFEAARRAGVRRMVYASSNHVTGFTPLSSELPADTAVRPDTLYGVSKAFGEALGRYYVDRYGFDVVAVRIGTCDWRPPDRRALATWLSPDDCARLVDAALRTPVPGYHLVWGVSANTRRQWSLAAGQAIGYHPHDDAERYVLELPPDGQQPVLAGDRLVGGGFTSTDYGIDQIAARW